MKTSALALAFFSLPAAALDDDKKLHFGASYFLGFAAGAQFPDNRPLAFGLAMVPGVLKEISDRKTTGFDGKDLLADALGAALGMFTSQWLVTHVGGQTVLAYRTDF